jgi:hypothetical protein
MERTNVLGKSHDTLKHQRRDGQGIGDCICYDVQNLLRAERNVASVRLRVFSALVVRRVNGLNDSARDWAPTWAMSQIETTPPTALFRTGNASEDSFSARREVHSTSGRVLLRFDLAGPNLSFALENPSRVGPAIVGLPAVPVRHGDCERAS